MTAKNAEDSARSQRKTGEVELNSAGQVFFASFAVGF
jgi:hypothetical protein